MESHILLLCKAYERFKELIKLEIDAQVKQYYQIELDAISTTKYILVNFVQQDAYTKLSSYILAYEKLSNICTKRNTFAATIYEQNKILLMCFFNAT